MNSFLLASLDANGLSWKQWGEVWKCNIDMLDYRKQLSLGDSSTVGSLGQFGSSLERDQGQTTESGLPMFHQEWSSV